MLCHGKSDINECKMQMGVLSDVIPRRCLYVARVCFVDSSPGRVWSAGNGIPGETRTRAMTAIRYSAKVVAVGCRRSVGGKREDEGSGCKPGTYFLPVDLVCECAAGGSSGPNAAEIRILSLALSTVLRS